MSEIDYYLAQEGANTPNSLTMAQYVSGSVVPILTIVATIVVALKGDHPIMMGSLIGATVLSLLVGPLQWAKSAVERKLSQFRDNRAAKSYLPRLRRQIEKFGDFVSGKPDTLHYITECYICAGHGQRLAMVGMPNAAAWKGRWDLFNQRLTREKPSAAALEFAVLEFHDMVGTYINLCAAAVFDRLPQELMAQMDARARKELGGFQQRFARFHSESEELLEEISRSRPRFERLPYNFAAVKPLP